MNNNTWHCIAYSCVEVLVGSLFIRVDSEDITLRNGSLLWITARPGNFIFAKDYTIVLP